MFPKNERPKYGLFLSPDILPTTLTIILNIYIHKTLYIIQWSLISIVYYVMRNELKTKVFPRILNPNVNTMWCYWFYDLSRWHRKIMSTHNINGFVQMPLKYSFCGVSQLYIPIYAYYIYLYSWKGTYVETTTYYYNNYSDKTHVIRDGFKRIIHFNI